MFNNSVVLSVNADARTIGGPIDGYIELAYRALSPVPSVSSSQFSRAVNLAGVLVHEFNHLIENDQAQPGYDHSKDPGPFNDTIRMLENLRDYYLQNGGNQYQLSVINASIRDHKGRLKSVCP